MANVAGDKKLTYLRLISGTSVADTFQSLIDFAWEHDQEFASFLGREDWMLEALPQIVGREKS